MASNPKIEYQVFICIFQKNSAENIGKMQKKSGIMKSGLDAVDAMPLFLLDNLLMHITLTST